ncbi:Tubulin tyrosine ligase [Giardia muris]|uniref:Tubulin tyrosine ligase n=1 Tax=Giardia muris TaxID=5742 RepID=A0A4Z1SLY1_GIAMU|nr:Tubulin tyrosine ligase [Giardia muris]|eukprot:TNJ26674.1 Tubulin tyrosine ligase [Giardia muris]
MSDESGEYGEFSEDASEVSGKARAAKRLDGDGLDGDGLDGDGVGVEGRPKAGKRKRVRVCLDNCKYPVIHEICRNRGWRLVGEGEDWNLLWSDRSVAAERLMRMRTYQRINHFPGMYEITRKDTLARNLNKARRLLPDEFDFYPVSFYLPADANELRQYAARASRKTVFITKPVASCQGKGIRLFKNVDSIDITEPQVIQEYMSRPYLIGGLKFDLRMYVVVLSVAPFMRLLVYEDGMARFATEPYAEPTSKNMRKAFMHLTNYAINKRNENFVFNAEEDEDNVGSKWGLQAVWDKIREDGGDPERLRQDIDAIFIKTVLAVLPNLQHTYASCRPAETKPVELDGPGMDQQYLGSNCYEVLGFDIMIDGSFKPWLIEVNHSPSFTCDTPLDYRIKSTLINGVLDIVNVTNGDRRQYARLERQRHMTRLYGKAGPPPRPAPKPPPRKGASGDAPKKISTFKTYEEHVQRCLGRLPFYQIYPLPKGCPDPYNGILQRIRNKGSADLSDKPVVVQKASSAQTAALQTAGVRRTASATPATQGTGARQQNQAQSQGQGQNQSQGQTQVQSGMDSGQSTSSPSRTDYIQGSAPPASSQGQHGGNIRPEPTHDVEPMDLLLRRALLEFEYGIPSRSIIFKGITAPVLLPQGPPRNDKLEKTRDAELLSKLRAMLKFGVREYAESVVQTGQRGGQTNARNPPPPLPQPRQDVGPYVVNRSKSSAQFHTAGMLPKTANPHVDSHTASVSRGTHYGTARVVRAHDEPTIQPIVYRGVTGKRR